MTLPESGAPGESCRIIGHDYRRQVQSPVVRTARVTHMLPLYDHCGHVHFVAGYCGQELHRRYLTTVGHIRGQTGGMTSEQPTGAMSSGLAGSTRAYCSHVAIRHVRFVSGCCGHETHRGYLTAVATCVARTAAILSWLDCAMSESDSSYLHSSPLVAYCACHVGRSTTTVVKFAPDLATVAMSSIAAT
jgi:hypothetical protein